jgi:predicted nucleic acid-binding protein
MTNLFIDTDIIIDFLIDRKPYSREAAIIFTLVDQKKLKAYASSLTFSNLFYVLRKVEPQKNVIAKLDSLSKILTVLKVDDQNIRDAIESGFPDFEDSIQYFCALDCKKVEVIITRNIRDYKKSTLPVMTPGDFLKSFVS